MYILYIKNIYLTLYYHIVLILYDIYVYIYISYYTYDNVDKVFASPVTQDSGHLGLQKTTQKLGSLHPKNASRDWWRNITGGPVSWMHGVRMIIGKKTLRFDYG